jgi:hypothetical protein
VGIGVFPYFWEFVMAGRFNKIEAEGDPLVLTGGMFAGRRLCDVPSSYLLWLYEKSATSELFLKDAARAELVSRLNKPVPEWFQKAKDSFMSGEDRDPRSAELLRELEKSLRGGPSWDESSDE